MRRVDCIAALCAGFFVSQVLAQAVPARPGYGDVLATAKPADWRGVDVENTLYLDLPAGRVVIELAPAFAPRHAENIKALAREKYFDGLAVIRSHDNYVAQWGDPDEKNPRAVKSAKSKLAAEYSMRFKDAKDLPPFARLRDVDGYAPEVGHSNGFPSARDPKTNEAWLTHCYAMVGVGRGTEDDSGSGMSLYAVTGHAPRHLDRNITVVGRVVQGIQHLSALPRGTGALGFYEKAEQRVPIKSVRVAADVPPAERTNVEVIRTDTPLFAALTEALRNRPGPWFKVPAGHVELCNVNIATRIAPAR
ncbi:MAG: peptidylprolyl isomerase [Betaproteobacteria bacterium]|nr:peptidylprolyl isomerase [Betaproteobacteria bacterium]